MNLKYNLIILITSFFLIVGCSSDKQKNPSDIKKELTVNISTYGNSWVVNDPETTKKIVTTEGIKNWGNNKDVIRTFVKINVQDSLSVGIKAKQPQGVSRIKITIGDCSKEIEIKNTNFKVIPVGKFYIKEKGYVKIDMQGLSKTGSYFGDISDIIIGGKAIEKGTFFVKEDFHFGRRGPSVHLGYKISESAGDVEWFYNEIEVPKGNDILGSYYMANGFGEGYFGIQVNSKTERRILFSVWSPFKTDNPKEIPEEQKIKLLRKGENVRTGEFGNEGSGGQSYRVFNWKTETRYRFLLRVQPTENNSTNYTAYFFAPEIGKWELIASFKRPKTHTYLKHPHSFLENFYTQMGQFTRKVNYCNQWVRNTKGKWFELTEAQFTIDATARKKARLDYAGGAEEQHFYLKNCGFFNGKTTADLVFKRKKSGKNPQINFEKLP